jgi:hypothetical protein
LDRLNDAVAEPMADIIPLKSVQPRKLSRQQFKAEVGRLIGLGALKVHVHLKRDHPERAISHAQIEKCLQVGTLQCDPFLNEFGNWKAEVFRHMAGHELTVSAVIEWDEQVIVITAY